LGRGKPLKAKKPRRDPKTEPPKATRRFRAGTFRRCKRDPETGLWVCPACGGLFAAVEMECHHIIEKERIKKYVAGLMLESEAHRLEVLIRRLWDHRNGIAVCKNCHAEHTNRKRPLSRALLPECVWVFADEIGLSYVIDRYYA
jgi:hypothetical protein